MTGIFCVRGSVRMAENAGTLSIPLETNKDEHDERPMKNRDIKTRKRRAK
jgi:hypothetical protein